MTWPDEIVEKAARAMVYERQGDESDIEFAKRLASVALDAIAYDVVLRSEMTEERRFDRRNGDRRLVTDWEPLP